MIWRATSGRTSRACLGIGRSTAYAGCPLTRSGSVPELRFLWRLVFDFLLERLPIRLETDEALFARRHLARGQKTRAAIRNLGGGSLWLLIAHKVTFLAVNRNSNRPQARRIDIHARIDRSARHRLGIGRVPHGQDLEREDNLPAAERAVAVDRQRLVVQVRDEKAARLALVVLHEDRGADLAILLGNVLEAIGENQRLVPRAEDLVAVDHHFDGLAGGFALEPPMHRRSEDFVVAVDVAQRELDAGEDVSRLPVGDLVGQLDELAVADDVRRWTHRKS